MKKGLIVLFCLVLILGLTSCNFVDDTTQSYKQWFELLTKVLAPKEYSEKIYGFWHGLFQGALIGFALIAKLIGFKVGFYADHNTGFTYWLGYIIGLLFLAGSASSKR
jgi:hypothetical protein